MILPFLNQQIYQNRHYTNLQFNKIDDVSTEKTK